MNKKIILHVETPEITLDNIPEYAIIAMEGDRKRKYILSIHKNNIAFMSGNGNWDSAVNKTELLTNNMTDGRVTFHVFTDLKALAKWLLE